MNTRRHDWSSHTCAVDIRLCGGVPRSDLRGAPTSLKPSPISGPLSTSPLAATNASHNDHSTHLASKKAKVSVLQNKSNLTEMRHTKAEAPKWAVPASGETRLEPVCESLGRQCAVDLTRKAAFHIGRAPNADIQLMHATSSRRHAMLFHHSNGSCYVVDCGSAHGTYVNGQRIPLPQKNGCVVPHRVRRGALIRFGGVGAPCFLLKSFSFNLLDITSVAPEKSDTGELIRRNTRINALGKTTHDFVTKRSPAIMQPQQPTVNRKRSFDSLDTRDTLDHDDFKRRCMSPPLSEVPVIAMVSPDLSISLAHKHVTFSDEQPQVYYASSVTPEESGDEDNADP